VKEYNLRQHYNTSPKHIDGKHKNMDMEPKLQKVENLKISLRSQQATFTKVKTQSEAAVKINFIVTEEVAKSACPFTGEFVKTAC